jgi:hypothetical protein
VRRKIGSGRGGTGGFESLSTLAAVLGLDPAAMTNTVTHRNHCCDAKDEIEFGRKLMLESIVEKPFYAIELSP